MNWKDSEVYNILKTVSDQNVKPHMMFLILKTHDDGEYHWGKELVKQGYDITEVYDTIKILVAKGYLSRHGKKTLITSSGSKVLKTIDAIIGDLNKLAIW